jgi:predicted MFS family arabinose efflux permease
VERQFGLGAEALAVLTAAFGVGALLSGIFVSARGKMHGTTKLAVFAPAAISLAMVGFIATSWFPFGVLCAAIMGAAMSVHGICAQTLAQSASDPAMRGRVLSLWGLIVRAFPALGALMLGAAGEIFGMTLPTLAAVLLSAIAIAWGIKRLPAMARVLEGEGAGDSAKR